jgi:hypothetical protein
MNTLWWWALVLVAWCNVAVAVGIVWGRAIALADRIELPTPEPSSSVRTGERSC